MRTLTEFQAQFPVTPFDPNEVFAEPQWLIDGLWLGGGAINGLFGVPKAGKSRFLGWMLVTLLSGKAAIAELPPGTRLPQRVLYVHAEESKAAVVRRLKHYAEALQVSTADWGERLLFMPGMNLQLHKLDRQRAFQTTIRSTEAALLVIDPLIRVHGAQENDATAMSQIHNAWRQWSEALQLDFVILHHTGKLHELVPVEQDISRWARGTSDIAAMLDAATYLDRYGDNRIKVFRAGRFSPQRRLILLDRGDDAPWTAESRNARS